MEEEADAAGTVIAATEDDDAAGTLIPLPTLPARSELTELVSPPVDMVIWKRGKSFINQLAGGGITTIIGSCRGGQ